MCFSADASFGAAACLLPMGLYSLRQAIRIRPAFVPFALTPIAFGIQQLAEAFVWRGLNASPPRSVDGPAAVFLFFAIAWWPFWFPFSAAFAAPTPQRRLPFVLFTILSTLWFILAVRILRDAGYQIFSLGWSMWGPEVQPLDSGSLSKGYEAPNFIATLEPEDVLARFKARRFESLRSFRRSVR